MVVLQIEHKVPNFDGGKKHLKAIRLTGNNPVCGATEF